MPVLRTSPVPRSPSLMYNDTPSDKFIPAFFYPTLLRLQKKLHWPDMIDELNFELVEGRAFGFFDPNIGGVVVKVERRQATNVLWFYFGFSLMQDALALYLPVFERMAKDAHVDVLAFQSKRKGFARIAPKLGFYSTGVRDGFTVYEKKVIQ